MKMIRKAVVFAAVLVVLVLPFGCGESQQAHDMDNMGTDTHMNDDMKNMDN